MSNPKQQFGTAFIRPAAYTAGRMKASAWQKAVNEDQNNDFLYAVDSAKRRVAKPIAKKPKQEKKKSNHKDKKQEIE